MMAYPAKTERNRELFADYRGGMLRAEVADKYGLTLSGIDSLLRHHGVTLPKREAVKRWKTARQRYCGGRPPVWPDCPPELHGEYMRLRRTYQMPAAEARRVLEAAQ